MIKKKGRWHKCSLTALVMYVFKINSSKLKGRALLKLDQLIKIGSGSHLELDCKNVSNF